MTSVHKEEQVTLYDFLRYCDNHHEGSITKVENCLDCELFKKGNCVHFSLRRSKINEINEIILDWIKTHPIKSRKDEFIEHYPNVKIESLLDLTYINICPLDIDKNRPKESCAGISCIDCKRNYWNEEVE